MTAEEFLALARWNLGPGQVDFFPPGETEPLIPLLLQLQEGVAPRDFARQAGPLLSVSTFYTDVLPELDQGFHNLSYITALAVPAFFEPGNLATNLALKSVVDAALSPPLFRRSYSASPKGWAINLPTLGPAPPPPGAVILGIIDDSIAFAHERFLGPGGTGTRVEYFWMQDGPPPGPFPFGRFRYGRELRKLTVWPRRGIDDLRSDSTYAGLVDEDEVYRRAGVVDPITPPGHKAITWRRAFGEDPPE